MCRSMVEIQSVAAEIRRGKKEDRYKIEITGQKYNGPLLHRAAIKISKVVGEHIYQTSSSYTNSEVKMRSRHLASPTLRI